MPDPEAPKRQEDDQSDASRPETTPADFPQLDLANAQNTKELEGLRGTKYEDVSGLQRHGVLLAWGVLGIIAVLAVMLVCLVAYGEYWRPPAEITVAQGLLQQAAVHYAAASSPDALREANETLTHLAQMKRASRDFWMGFSQFLLLNLLLPVLTAILGYVFGTVKNNQS
jgi:hypothetical protein